MRDAARITAKNSRKNRRKTAGIPLALARDAGGLNIYGREP
jgi:hypothetical protein